MGQQRSSGNRRSFGHRTVMLAALAAVSAFAQGAEMDRTAAAANGKIVVDAHCGACHSGEWEGESYASIVALLRGMYLGDVAHRFKIHKLTEEESRQVAAYWAMKPAKKREPRVTFE